MSRSRVLVVDDDAAVLRSTAGVLRQAKHQVETADSAAAALELLERDPFDAVVTDVQMPGASGLDLVREVRRRWEDVPLIVITAFPSIESAVDAMRSGG